MSAAQGRRLSDLLRAVYGRSAFYTRKLDDAGLDVNALRFPQDLTTLPLTSKAELIADQAEHPPWGSGLTEPLERYTRYCQTSSTTGSPLRWIDTNESWQWLVDCWKEVFRAARVTPADRVFFPFSFGPFLGFWVGFDAGSQMGLLCVPGGGMSSRLRLSVIDSIGATIVCCTPTYALRLAEVAAEEWPDRPLANSTVRALIVAGEPGGSIPATRERIERSWGARVIDHHGLTEAGPISFECWESPGALHLNEDAFVCEVLDPVTGRAVPDGYPGELVVTNLGRTANPIVRYKTADIVVRRSDPCVCGRSWARLEGGVLARADDMINIRGVNVYPTSIEAVVRRFPEIVEFRTTVSQTHSMRMLTVEIEVPPAFAETAALADQVAARLKEALGLSVRVGAVDAGVLPRFEMKARRFVVEV
jgi:phenylacetate-CoA ligase